MLEHVDKFGIYLNSETGEVVRITSPYWFPPENEWVVVTKEVNATLTEIRELARAGGIYKDPDSIRWGRIPLLD